MNEWKVIFATVVIFGTGVISGGLLVNYADLAHVRVANSPVSPEPVLATNTPATTNAVGSGNLAHNPNVNHNRLPEILTKQFVDRLEHDLHLTLGQRADIEKIIADSQEQMRRDFQSARQAARQQIREELTPDQKKAFDDLFRNGKPAKKSVDATNTPASSPPADPTGLPPASPPQTNTPAGI